MIDTVAWVHLENGRILCARPRGKGVFYVPGGKREGAESDLQTLLREVAEELTVALRPETVRHAGTYQADHPDGTAVRMSCYTGEYSGTLAASSEIDELAWFGYADRRGATGRPAAVRRLSAARPAPLNLSPAGGGPRRPGSSFHQCA